MQTKTVNVQKKSGRMITQLLVDLDFQMDEDGPELPQAYSTSSGEQV